MKLLTRDKATSGLFRHRGSQEKWWRCQLKDTLAISKTLKNSPGFTKLRSQISETKFSVFHDVIGKYYIVDSGLENGNICTPENYDNIFLILMNLSSCQLCFLYLDRLFRMHLGILGRPRNFTKIEDA